MTAQDQHTALLRLVPGKVGLATMQSVYTLSSVDKTVIGRDFRCQIALDPAICRSVSRKHVEITPVAGIETPDGQRFWQVCDLDSSNGTFINGQRLQKCHVLRVGDRITLGQNGPEFIFDYQPVSALEQSPAFSSASAAQSDLYPTGPPLQRLSSKPLTNSVSLTQLFPILSTGRELAHKAYLLPAVITILFVVLLFITIGNSSAFNLILATYLASVAYFFIYQLCGKRKPAWVILAVTSTTALILISPLIDLFIFAFHQLLPGDLSHTGPDTNLFVLIVKMFFGAGLMEELLKAVPVLIAYWLGMQFKPPFRQRIGVWEPLDGILLGAASAVGFTLMETLGVYVPASYQSAIAAGADAAQLAGLQLLIPRILGLIAGHMAYSGYFGYFIGLSALHRRQRKLILGVGYLTSATLHTLWNAAGTLSPVVLAIVGVVSYAFLGAAILKARALSPTRSQNFATRFHQ